MAYRPRRRGATLRLAAALLELPVEAGQGQALLDHPAQPGPAIGPFHWESRLLSKRELCRLRPSRTMWSRGDIQRQVGNAVPSLLAEVLGRSILAQLSGSGGAEEAPLRLLPRDQSPAPGPEPVRAVPLKFGELIGRHEAHPGTGKGYAARRWREGAWTSEVV